MAKEPKKGKMQWYFETFADKPAHKDLIRLIENHRKAKADRRLMNYTPEENSEWAEEEVYKLQGEWFQHNKRKLASLSPKAEALERKYHERHEPIKDLLERQRWETRYKTMSSERLEEEKRKYVDNLEESKLAEWSPDRLELLQAAITEKSGFSTELQTSMTLKKYDRPWEYEDPDLFKEIHLNESEFGIVRFVAEDDKIAEFDIAKDLIKGDDR